MATSPKCCHTIYGFLNLVSFTWCHVFKVHPRLEPVSIVHSLEAWHTLFVHSSVDGHLCCCCPLTHVNKTAMDICATPIFFNTNCHFWGVCLSRNGITGSYGDSMFNLSRTLLLIFDVGYLWIIYNGGFSLDRFFFFFLSWEFSHSLGPWDKNRKPNTHLVLTWEGQTQPQSAMSLPQYLSLNLPIHVAEWGDFHVISVDLWTSEYLNERWHCGLEDVVF